jgi:hypothetical protein
MVPEWSQDFSVQHERDSQVLGRRVPSTKLDTPRRTLIPVPAELFKPTLPPHTPLSLLKRVVHRKAEGHESRKLSEFLLGQAGKKEDSLGKLCAWVMRLRFALRSILHGGDDYSRYMRQKAFADRYPIRPDEWAIVCPFQSGDVYLYSSFAKALMHYHGGAQVTFFTKPQHAFIPRLFPSVARAVPIEPPFDFDEIGSQEFSSSHRASNLGRLFKVDTKYSMLMAGCKGVNLMDCWRGNLRLPWNAEPDTPRRPSDRECETARRLLAQNGVPEGRSVIISPDAVSTDGMPQVDFSFWEQLAIKLQSLGFCCVTNMGPTTPLVRGTIGLAVDLELFRAVVMLAGHFVALRSGLCDLVSDLPISITVLYPPCDFHGGRFIQVAGLRQMGLNPSALELEIDVDNYQRTLDRIQLPCAIALHR